MTDKFKLFSLIIALFLVLSVLDHSKAGISEVKQSLKKDSISSKSTNEAKLKNKSPLPKSKSKTNIKLKAELPEIKKDYPNSFLKPSEVPYKIVKKTINGKIQVSRFPFIPDKDTNKVKQPQRISDSKTAKRIGEKNKNLDELTGVEGELLPSNWEFKEPPITNTALPSIPDNNDSRKKEALALLKYISQNLPDYSDPTQKNPNPQMPGISKYCYSLCENYSDYPEICAYARLYQAEAWMQGVQLTLTKYQIESCRIALNRLNESIDIYSNFAKNNPDCAAAVQIMKGRAKLLQDCIDKHVQYLGYENKYYYLPRANRHLGNLKRIKSDVLKPNDDLYSSDDSSISGIHDQTTSYISTILMNIYLMNDTSQFKAVEAQLDSFYKSIPREITIKFREDFDENSAVKERTLTVTKTGDNYVNAKRYNAYMIVENCEKDEKLNIESYHSQFEEMNQYASSSHDGEAYYTNTREILKEYLSILNIPLETTAVYFCHAEQQIEDGKFYEQEDLLMLELDINANSLQPLFPIREKIVNATTHKRKTLVIKRSSLYANSYCSGLFRTVDIIDNDDEDTPIPPPSNDQPTLALKKSDVLHVDERSIGVFQGEPEYFKDYLSSALIHQLDVPPDLYDKTKCSYFNKRLVRTYIENKKYNSIDNSDKNNKNYLLCGGSEYVYYPKGNAYVPTKKTAMFFIIQGHSANRNGAEVGEKSNDGIYVTPEELSKSKRYQDNMKVLILDACFCLKFYKTWNEVLPNGVILGYNDKVGFRSMNNVLGLMANELDKASTGITPNQIAGKWLKMNEKSFNTYLADKTRTEDKRPKCTACVVDDVDEPGKRAYVEFELYLDEHNNKHFLYKATTF
ncbi:MAG TPA: hypothetical protein PKI94_07660 [Candidatus Gastranaerophilaceae bacterium]|nr:hypothetical protein [Candidatus Gastranaerophilaceae bacterium]